MRTPQIVTALVSAPSRRRDVKLELRGRRDFVELVTPAYEPSIPL
jgi:hypothetical protein